MPQLKKLTPSEEILNYSFKQVNKYGPKKKKKGKTLIKEKHWQADRLSMFIENVVEKLEKESEGFPNLGEMPKFFQELLNESVEVNELRKILGGVKKTKKLLVMLKMNYIREIFSIRDENEQFEIKKLSEAFYGRACSMVKKLNESILFLRVAKKNLRRLPNIRTDIPTVILAGYPNTGKTTLLNRLTGTGAKVASYAFTTTRLQLGFFSVKYHEFQVIDTPGLLDRNLEKRNPAERRTLTALKHLADLIVFVVDPTQYCGFSMDEQAKLLTTLDRTFQKKILIVITKKDIATPEEVEAAKKVLNEQGIMLEGLESKGEDLKKKIFSSLAGVHKLKQEKFNQPEMLPENAEETA